MGVVSQSPLAMLLLVTPYTIVYLLNQRKETHPPSYHTTFAWRGVAFLTDIPIVPCLCLLLLTGVNRA